MNGFGERLANSVWDEMVFENHLFHVTKYSTINGIFRIVLQGLLHTANFNFTMTQWTSPGTHCLCGIAASFPSSSTPPPPPPPISLVPANCVALEQVVFLNSFFFFIKDHLTHRWGFHIPSNLLLGGLPKASKEPPLSFVATQLGVV